MLQEYKKYLKGKYNYNASTSIAIGLAIWVIGGFIGFVYEVIFYWANTGFRTIYWRGGTFGPWIEIYCITALLIYKCLHSLRRQPWFVFLLSAVVCSLVQLIVGLGLYYFFDGARAWNYNLEILNYGSIGGFICLRSILEFGILGLLIIYVIAPLVIRMANHMSGGGFVALWFILGIICIADIAYNDLVCVILPGFTGAKEIYKELGFNYVQY